MTEFQLLARKVTRLPVFRWREGMKAGPDPQGLPGFRLGGDPRDWSHDLGLRGPDLTDPLTAGALLSVLPGRYHVERDLMCTNGAHLAFVIRDGEVTLGDSEHLGVAVAQALVARFAGSRFPYCQEPHCREGALHLDFYRTRGWCEDHRPEEQL